jgi:hypothetical protein
MEIRGRELGRVRFLIFSSLFPGKAYGAIEISTTEAKQRPSRRPLHRLSARSLFRQRFRRAARQGTHVMHFAGSGKEALELLSGEIDPGMILRLSDHHAGDGRPPARRDQRFAGLEWLKAQLPAAAT